MIVKHHAAYLWLRSPEILAIWTFGLVCDMCGFERLAELATKKLLKIVE